MKKENLNQYNPAQAIDLFNQENSLKTWLKQKRKLPRNIRYGLISLETEGLIKKISEKYNFMTPEKIGSVSVLIRNFLAGLLKEEDLTKEIQKRYNFNNTENANFLIDIKKAIREIQKIGLNEVKKDLVTAKFSDLLEKIPAVKKQEIGIYDIVLPEENIEREPTIENWITDYKLRKNDQQETTILNVGDYLYNNKNTQDLNKEEKEKLSMILNAYEKNEVIYYNKLFEEIDFEILKILNKKKEDKINITGFNSKPYHDTDNENEKFSDKNKTKVTTEEDQKVLNLSKYV